ncbi:MAG TPA: GNAT family N-acetyltransferase [candidate division Zixibacteria bacterium]|nr:GNAT family N-acetyltransferase [candidate division Zixibacteria bacterium]MDD4916722.1 GNAT family N-acetyltransferase [candidate division Zixibacteria bacterium]HOD66943.1 GNAT family N-acetyltransferase [candidate division Zixibacteria bacterium]HPM37962.1 GNAT family N-acetyltransferase [candidate division Zixibacteria bacterium]
MDRHKLDRLFDPRRIALIGVTINPNSVGGKVLANLVAGGYRGVVYPVNPDSEAVMGIPCYPSVAALPRTPDLAVICAPAEKVPAAVLECGRAGILGIIILSAGFKETGPEGAALEQEIRAARRQFPGMRIIGPNCLGLIVPSRNLNISFAGGMPRAGNVAFLSQSGALCTSVLDWAMEGRIGFSHFVSIGNTIDVDFGDLIDYFGADDSTRSIILYIESIARAPRFMTAARAFARTKPIIAFKAGRFPESAQVAASHTGALASEDAVYDAAFQRIGLARVYHLANIFDCVQLIGRNRIPTGPNLGIVTNAGGPGVIAADALIAAKGSLARLSDDTLAQLNAALPSSWSHGNPVDILGDATSKRLEKAAQIVLADPAVEALLVILTPQAMTNVTAAARVVGKLAESTAKPVLAAWLGGASMREGMQILTESGVATYRTPEQAVGAFMTLVDYGRNLQTLYETPKDLPVEFELDRARLRADFVARHCGPHPILSEAVSKDLLEGYGIPTARPRPAADADEAVRIAGELGYPVVIKILSPDITHKTDVGGVALGLEDDAMVRSAFAHMMLAVGEKAPRARIEGVTVQPMIDPRDSLEMILGIKKDATFGTVMMAGMGGVAAELLGDRSLGFPPLNERLARRMLESLKIWPLLQGYRGRPRANVDRLLEVLIRLSYLAADFPEIAELDINPLLVSPRDVVALDARIVIDPALVGRSSEPYSHLALRPYPEKYVARPTLRDGTTVTLRPIKPEDEPLWLAFLASCSKESIYSRFRYFFHWNSHDVATRFCYIDYNREIAIVAEIVEGGERRIIGIGRLIADPDHEEVEYAVLIADAWQKKELGSLLTDYCMEVASRWKLKRIVAQTTTDNRPMISVFEKRGFAIAFDETGTGVRVVKELA